MDKTSKRERVGYFPDFSSPFYWYGLTLILAWISNQMSRKVWDKIIYPFLNFNGASVEVWD